MVKKYIFEFMRLLYWLPFRTFVQKAPLGLSFRLAKVGGNLFYIASREKRMILENGFRFLLGNGNKDAVVKKTFINYALNSIEVFLYPDLSKKKIQGMVQYQGLEHIETALRKNRGVILLHAHFGNEEFLMPAVGYLGYKVNQIASRLEPPYLKGPYVFFPNMVRRYAFKKRIDYRETLPVKFIYIDRGLKRVYSALKNNELILWALDGREGDISVYADLLGKRAGYSQGPFRVAIKTGAEVLPVFLVRQQDHRHLLVVEKPLDLQVTKNLQCDVSVNTQRFVSILEEYVKDYPHQYLRLFWYDRNYIQN